MNIECPNCLAAYDVPDNRLGRRRVVRCGTCSHAWSVGDPEASTDTAASAPPHRPSDAHDATRPDESPAIAAPGDRLAPPRPAAPRDALLVGAWVTSALLIIGIATTACAWRGDIAAAWPPAARILGTPPQAAVVAAALVPRAAPHQYTSADAKIPAPARHD